MFKSIKSGTVGNSTFLPANILISFSFIKFLRSCLYFLIISCFSYSIGKSIKKYISVLFNNSFLIFLYLFKIEHYLLYNRSYYINLDYYFLIH